jgi:hypothetical protein
MLVEAAAPQSSDALVGAAIPPNAVQASELRLGVFDVPGQRWRGRRPLSHTDGFYVSMTVPIENMRICSSTRLQLIVSARPMLPNFAISLELLDPCAIGRRRQVMHCCLNDQMLFPGTPSTASVRHGLQCQAMAHLHDTSGRYWHAYPEFMVAQPGTPVALTGNKATGYVFGEPSRGSQDIRCRTHVGSTGHEKEEAPTARIGRNAMP